MQKTAIVCVTNDLSTDQRVHKTCMTLAKCGYWVIEYGRLLPKSLPLERPYFTMRRKHWFQKGPLFYAEYNIRLFLYLMTKEVDLIFSNDLDTLPAAYLVSKLRNKKLIYDSHELFTEVPELINRPIVKWVWQKAEDLIIPHLNQSITVCQSIADYYNRKYNVDMKVVRNIPVFKNTKQINQLSYPDKKIILYQGALNVGRGLEWVIEAMPLVNDGILVIFGEGDIQAELVKLTKKLGVEQRVIFMGKVETIKLHEYTPSASIGLCLLEEKGLSYYYALPNRIFDYIQARVPVLATNFPEIANIVTKYKTGILINQYDPEYLAEVINNMLRSPINTDHFSALSKELSWENEEKVLIDILNS